MMCARPRRPAASLAPSTPPVLPRAVSSPCSRRPPFLSCFARALFILPPPTPCDTAGGPELGGAN
eukprot:CAMPEP_0196747516 /NCGR_PEP_ID=MMETSP1091-20130531/70045_1 /TAXON_ID=302021 /ORGANISM="Rhodomonas sp., Strain CCMP768" /LENGTH=64 /DNA_ID=CAMNT_0042094669 /DNA_START=28 /DNA_END=219 /DNA_ORIENTATION=-